MPSSSTCITFHRAPETRKIPREILQIPNSMIIISLSSGLVRVHTIPSRFLRISYDLQQPLTMGSDFPLMGFLFSPTAQGLHRLWSIVTRFACTQAHDSIQRWKSPKLRLGDTHIDNDARRIERAWVTSCINIL